MKRVALLAPFLLVVFAPAAHADTLQSFSAAARATGYEVTQDGANANFHPQGELDWDLASATLGSGAHALSTFAWPGAAGGNVGSLVALLGGPDVSALNDPVRAEVDSGGTQEQSTTAPSGSAMSASVKPENEGDRESRASTTTANGSGAVGASSASSKVLLHGGTLTASAQSSATGINIAGVVHIDSVLSTASSTSNGGAPTSTGSTIVHGMTIAGQQAYVDANGVHMGQPGQPSDPVAVQTANTALNAAGVQIYFTGAHDIVVGQVSYFYAGSLLFYWAPPNDTGKDSFTLSLGGAAVAMNVTAGPGALDTFDTGSTDSAFTPIPDNTAAPTLEMPAPVGAPAVAQPAKPAIPAPAINAQPAAATLPRGLGGWVSIAVLGALAGAALLSRVPALLASAAAAGCPRERASEGADE